MSGDSLIGASLDIWKGTFDLYEDVFKKRTQQMKNDKAKELLELEKWYQKELPGLLKERQDKSLTIDELTKIMQWKLLRGKFRPRLMNLIKSNTAETVTEVTTLGFEYLPDIEKAIKKLSELKGVGPATASAILCAGCPQVPFMSDEAMMALPVGKTKLEYTIKAYKLYLEQIRTMCVTKLQSIDPKGQWNEHKVELTLWTFQTASKSFPDILPQDKKQKRQEIIDSVDENPHKKMKTF